MMREHRHAHTRQGSLECSDELTRKLVPFDVPVGTTSIRVSYSYTGRDEGNAVDLGLLGVDERFRGYSGGSKFEIIVANDEASPGYIPGLIQPGEWYVLLGIYTIAVPATYHIDIELDDAPRRDFTLRPAPTRLDYRGDLKLLPGVTRKPRWLKGDMHMHTVYSDGHFTLEQLIAKSQKRGLDFIFSTEHNTYSANQVWGKYAPGNGDGLGGGNLLIGRGIEVTTHFGHWNAVGLLPEQYIDPVIHDKSRPDDSLVPAIQEVHKQNGLAIINHPFAECKCCEWGYSFHDHMDCIEVWNGPWKRHPKDESNIRAVQKWDELLRQGKVFTASGGSDIHEDSFEIAEPCTRVLAEEVSVESILRGMRARRVYLTQHPSYEIEFSLGCGDQEAGIGDWLELPKSDEREIVARVRLKGFTDFTCELLTEEGVAHRSDSESVIDVAIKSRYVRVEIHSQAGDMLGLSNPIWVIRT